MLDHFLRNGILSLTFVALYLLIIMGVTQRKRRICALIGVALLTLFMTAIFQLTGTSAMNGLRLPSRADGFSFVPFVGLIEIVQTSVAYREPLYALSNIGGNLLMFVPLGFFLSLLWKPFRMFWRTSLVGFSTSLLIECTQIFVGRGFDVDDLLLNTLGAMVGYFCYLLLRKLVGPALARCTVSRKNQAFVWTLLPYLCILLPYLVSFFMGFYDRAIYMGL